MDLVEQGRAREYLRSGKAMLGSVVPDICPRRVKVARHVDGRRLTRWNYRCEPLHGVGNEMGASIPVPGRP